MKETEQVFKAQPSPFTNAAKIHSQNNPLRSIHNFVPKRGSDSDSNG